MRKAKIFVNNNAAGTLVELVKGKKYKFSYFENYNGEPVSLKLPLDTKNYEFDEFPTFFDGLLPEGFQLEALLREKKIDRNDFFSQLIAVGQDMVGTVTVEEESE